MSKELNPNEVLEDTSPTEDKPKDEQRELSAKEGLLKYADERATSSIINNTHSRSTFLINDKLIAKLNDVIAYLEVTNGVGSQLIPEGTKEKDIEKGQLLAKGAKSKIVNHSLNKFIKQLENERNAKFPNVLHKKQNVGTVKNKKYHNYYMFTENGETYGIEQDNRGKELRYLSTEPGESEKGVERGVTKEYIQKWFDEIEDQTVKTGAPRKNDK